MFLRDTKGQGMLVVMAITLAMFLMCSALLVMGTNARKVSVFEVDQEKAYYTAEAGVEKVLADAKNGPAWLKNLSVGAEYDFLSNNLGSEMNYGEGAFEYIKVKKLAEDERVTSLEIECRGRCGGSAKRVRVNADLETVYAENLFRGLWAADGSTPGGLVFNLASDSYFSGGGVVIAGGSNFTGDIYSRGTVCLQLDGESAAGISGDIYTLGGAAFTGTGPVAINGTIYVDDISKVPDEVKDITMVLPAGELDARIPEESEFPALLSAERLAWYQKNAGYKELPPVVNSAMAFQNSIYFLDGGCELSGTYSGSALIVVDGSVELGGLKRSGGSDSLAVLATGPVSSGAGSGEIDALIYCGGQVNLGSGTIVKGSVLAAGLAGQAGPLSIMYDGGMLDVFRGAAGWTFCFVRVTRWSE